MESIIFEAISTLGMTREAKGKEQKDAAHTFSVKATSKEVMDHMHVGNDKYSKHGCEAYLFTVAAGVAACLKYMQENDYGTLDESCAFLNEAINEKLKFNPGGMKAIVIDEKITRTN